LQAGREDLNKGWKMNLAEPKQSVNLVEAIIVDLRTQILSGTLKPGRRISQPLIAKHYQVSRAPVREALRALSSEGLVVMEPGRSAVVSSLDGSDLYEVYLLREQLEPMAIALAVPLVTEDDIEEAGELLAQLDAMPSVTDTWTRLDEQYHAIWYRRVPLPRTVGIVEKLWNASRRYRYQYNIAADAFRVSNLEHRLLLEAVRARRAEDAAAILKMHLQKPRLSIDVSAPLSAVVAPAK
jgi:DNA-binding GntR family transcriptional regulator